MEVRLGECDMTGYQRSSSVNGHIAILRELSSGHEDMISPSRVFHGLFIATRALRFSSPFSSDGILFNPHSLILSTAHQLLPALIICRNLPVSSVSVPTGDQSAISHPERLNHLTPLPLSHSTSVTRLLVKSTRVIPSKEAGGRSHGQTNAWALRIAFGL